MGAAKLIPLLIFLGQCFQPVMDGLENESYRVVSQCLLFASIICGLCTFCLNVLCIHHPHLFLVLGWGGSAE